MPTDPPRSPLEARVEQEISKLEGEAAFFRKMETRALSPAGLDIMKLNAEACEKMAIRLRVILAEAPPHA